MRSLGLGLAHRAAVRRVDRWESQSQSKRWEESEPCRAEINAEMNAEVALRVREFEAAFVELARKAAPDDGEPMAQCA